MCGIVAFLGNGNIFKILSCLKNLQNRGYDSAGFSYINDNKFIIHNNCRFVPYCGLTAKMENHKLARYLICIVDLA